MTNRMRAGIASLMLAQALAGCDHAGSPFRSPTAPSQTPVVQPVPSPTLKVFTEPSSGLSTSDVRDAQDHIVQFNTAGELIWAADGTHLPGYMASGLYIPAEKACSCWLEVRFGTRDGERRAYLTADYGHSNPGSLVDLAIAGDVLIVSPTSVFPPGTFRLSGLVTEVTPAGAVPLEGVGVWRLYGSGWQFGTTDKNGFYEIQGLYDGSNEVAVVKEGFENLKSIVSVSGDTRFDAQLVRR